MDSEGDIDGKRYWTILHNVYNFFKDNDVNILEDGEDERSELVVLDPMHVRLLLYRHPKFSVCII